MLTAATRIKVTAFLVIGVLVVGYLGVRYANLGPLIGFRGYYTVTVDLPDAGGIFPNADVTYRGVTIGRVGEVDLTGDGVAVVLHINDSAPPIPADLEAAVADRSAVGEQYIDLRPKASGKPYLTEGATIPPSATTIPLPVRDLLLEFNDFAASVPTGSLQTVVDELYKATDGQGPNLQVLLDSGHSFINAANKDVPQTSQLINDDQQVLQTQIDETNELNAFATNARLLAGQLDRSDADIRRLIAAVPQAADQVNGLLAESGSNLGVLLANLLTTSELTLTRQNGIRELLVQLPPAVAAGSTVVANGVLNFGMSLTFFAPLPCTAGYGGTTYRNGLDTSPGPPLNTAARCTLPAGSGVDVRGSANAPSGGGVPTPANPG